MKNANFKQLCSTRHNRTLHTRTHSGERGFQDESQKHRGTHPVRPGDDVENAENYELWFRQCVNPSVAIEALVYHRVPRGHIDIWANSRWREGLVPGCGQFGVDGLTENLDRPGSN